MLTFALSKKKTTTKQPKTTNNPKSCSEKHKPHINEQIIGVGMIAEAILIPRVLFPIHPPFLLRFREVAENG